MHTLTIKQNLQRLKFSEDMFEQIYTASFRKRPKHVIHDKLDKAFQAPAEIPQTAKANAHTNVSVSNEPLIEHEMSVERSYMMGELIDNYDIRISLNREVYNTLKVDLLNMEQETMAKDLIRKDPNYCSILNHMVQKFHKFHLKINPLQANQPSPQKTDFMEILFSNSKVAKIKLVNSKDKKQAKQIVCFHILKLMFPAVFELAKIFINQGSYNPPITAPANNQILTNQPNGQLITNVNHASHQASPYVDHNAQRDQLIILVNQLMQGFNDSFEIYSEMLSYQNTQKDSHDSFLNTTGFIVVNDNVDNPINILYNYFTSKFPETQFQIGTEVLPNGCTTLIKALVLEAPSNPRLIFSSMIEEVRPHVVEIFKEKFAKRIIHQLMI